MLAIQEMERGAFTLSAYRNHEAVQDTDQVEGQTEILVQLKLQHSSHNNITNVVPPQISVILVLLSSFTIH